MNSTKFLTMFCVSLFYFNAIAQTPIEVSLNARMQDDKIARSLAVLPVYVFKSIEIEPFTLFGIDDKKKQEQAPLVIKQMPDMANMRDTGYTYIYFSGANNDINQGYCLTLIGNYKRSRSTIYFFVDRNNNLDFSDDGLPDSLTYMHEDFVMKLSNLHNNKAQHHIKLSRIEYGKNYSYKKLLTAHFKKHSGTKVFANINYCYREQRLNTLGGSYISETDSFTIALKDMNNDGIFNESCMDKLYVGGVGDEIHTEEMSYILPAIDDVYFEWNKKRYQVKSIDPTGASVTLVEVINSVLSKKLEVGKRVPEFSFINIENQKEDLKKYKKKPTFIYFWDEATLTAEDTMYLNKLHTELKDQINVITLNYDDNQRNVRKYHYYSNIQWPIAFASYQIGKLFYLESLNRGYLTSKKLKLSDDDVSPKEVYESMTEGLDY
ncbi:MAG: hypothetical protein ACI9JN_000686 [Bacteroidia bacterium]|jgi:hypothetical protein